MAGRPIARDDDGMEWVNTLRKVLGVLVVASPEPLRSAMCMSLPR